MPKVSPIAIRPKLCAASNCSCRATACVLMPKVYLRLRLTGEKVSDPSDATGTLWLDVARRDWSDALLDAGGIRRA